MAAFHFNLDKVLDYRARLVDLRARDLAAAQGQVASIDARMAEVRAEQDRCSRALDGGSLDVVRMSARTAWIARLDGVLKQLSGDRAAAQAKAEQARSALQAAWRDREILEQLKTRKRRQWELEESRRDTAHLDEVGAQRSRHAAGIAG
jgi:flagellar FliJ protein